MECRLKVSTDTLREKADEISDSIAVISREWQDLSDTVTQSTSYWEGDTSDKHQKYLNSVRDDVDMIIRRLSEHPTDLLKMAGIYEGAEDEASDLAKALPANVIL